MYGRRWLIDGLTIRCALVLFVFGSYTEAAAETLSDQVRSVASYAGLITACKQDSYGAKQMTRLFENAPLFSPLKPMALESFKKAAMEAVVFTNGEWAQVDCDTYIKSGGYDKNLTVLTRLVDQLIAEGK